jgi:uncharacterized protein (TIGR02611 family)
MHTLYYIIVNKFAHHWKRAPRAVRLPIVFIVGWIVVAAGLIMLITPGPGWAAIFLGFAILATEFASAGKVRDHLVRILKIVVGRLRRLWQGMTKR